MSSRKSALWISLVIGLVCGAAGLELLVWQVGWGRLAQALAGSALIFFGGFFVWASMDELVS